MILVLDVDTQLTVVTSAGSPQEVPLKIVAQAFSHNEVQLRTRLGHYALTRNVDTIVGIRRPFFVILQGCLYGAKRERFPQGHVGRVVEEDLGTLISYEVAPQ